MISWFMRKRNVVSKLLAKKFRKWIRRHENKNYNLDTNGEKVVIQKLSKFNFDTIFDVGGNVGDYSLLLRTYFPDATIHTFEIMEDTFNLLKERTEHDKNMIVNPFGLSNENGSINVKYFGKGSGVNSIHDYPHKGTPSWKECNVRKGDDYTLENNLSTIDFLKIDTEGSENLVLEGLTNTLLTKNVKVIQFEYGYINVLTKFLLHDFYQFFKTHDYIVGKVYPRTVEFKEYSLKDENFLGPNYIAVKKSEADIIKVLSNK